MSEQKKEEDNPNKNNQMKDTSNNINNLNEKSSGIEKKCADGTMHHVHHPREPAAGVSRCESMTQPPARADFPNRQ